MFKQNVQFSQLNNTMPEEMNQMSDFRECMFCFKKTKFNSWPPKSQQGLYLTQKGNVGSWFSCQGWRKVISRRINVSQVPMQHKKLRDTFQDQILEKKKNNLLLPYLTPGEEKKNSTIMPCPTEMEIICI